jgi:hypothetical protein
MKMACVKMDSRNLGEDQRSWKESTCIELLEKMKYADFFSFVVTCNQTWLYHYDPTTKHQSMLLANSVSESKESWNVKIKK